LAGWTHAPHAPDWQRITDWHTDDWGLTHGDRAISVMHHGRMGLIHFYDMDFGFSLADWWHWLCFDRYVPLADFYGQRPELVAQVEQALHDPTRKRREQVAEAGWPAFLETHASRTFLEFYTRAGGLTGYDDVHRRYERLRKMDQRVSLITLGVADMERSSAFYDGLGWARVPTEDGVIAYDLIGQTLGLYPIEKLAADMGLSLADLGRGAMTLGYNAPDREAVDGIMASPVVQARGKVIKPATEVFWGGYHGYFADPDGHIWEVAHNPYAPLGPKGEFQWNGAA
ncbi:MAG: VOC family protein, partial [Pseudomonadota bacterium]